MTLKHRAAVEALKAWAIEANQNHPSGLALACQALEAALGDHDAESQAFFTIGADRTSKWGVIELAAQINRRRMASATAWPFTTYAQLASMRYVKQWYADCTIRHDTRGNRR